MAPDPFPAPGAARGDAPAGPSGAQQPPPVGFDGVQQPGQQPALGNYPPVAGGGAAKPSGAGYPTVAPVGGSQLPAGYPGAPPGAYAPAAAPPGAVYGTPVGGGGAAAGTGPDYNPAHDKIGPFGITAWVLFVAGIILPFLWIVCAFLPLCARRAARGPKDFMAVRRAAVAASVALCFYLVLAIILGALVGTRFRSRRMCTDLRGRQYYC